MHMYEDTCVYTCICMYEDTYICTCICMRIYAYVYMYVYVYVYVYVYKYTYIHVYVHVYIHVYVYVYISPVRPRTCQRGVHKVMHLAQYVTRPIPMRHVLFLPRSLCAYAVTNVCARSNTTRSYVTRPIPM